LYDNGAIITLEWDPSVRDMFSRPFSSISVSHLLEASCTEKISCGIIIIPNVKNHHSF